MKRLLLLVAASAAISSAAAAQDVRSDAVACRDIATTGLYRRCALWIDGQRVRRGEEGVVVGRPGFFKPAAMTKLVVGDSAQRYAELFERRSRQSNAFLVGTAVFVTSTYVYIANRQCSPDCGNENLIAGAFTVGSMGLLISGVSLQVRAQRAAARAVWWNNERFSR